MSDRLQRLFGVLAAGALVAVALVPMPALAAIGPQQWSVKVGAQSSDASVQANAFYNNNITIDVGDTVTWTWSADEIHTVTFLSGAPEPPLFNVIPGNPPQLQPNFPFVVPNGRTSYDGTGLANSGVFGFVPGLTTFPLTFTKAGTYSYICIVHDGMDGTVTVNQAGTAYPATQATYDAQANALRTRLLGQGNSLAGRARGTAAPSDVTVGFGLLLPSVDATLALLRFEPTTRYVHAGDTVTFSTPDPQTPHTVTFGAAPPGGPVGAYNAIIPATNTCTSPSACDATINSPSDAVNSGFLANDPLFQKSNTFRAKFTNPGTYNYICALHVGNQMKGTIVVLP
jgi:plastocyanin